MNNEGSAGLLGGLGTIASKATEVGQKSWGGISNLVNSTSLNSFTVPFKGNYEDLSQPEHENRNKHNTPSMNFHGDKDSYSKNSQSEDYDSAKSNLSFKSYNTSSNSGSTSRNSSGDEARRKKSKSPKPKVANSPPPLISFDSSETLTADPVEKKTAVKTHKSTKTKKTVTEPPKREWDDDAWDMLNQ